MDARGYHPAGNRPGTTALSNVFTDAAEAVLPLAQHLSRDLIVTHSAIEGPAAAAPELFAVVRRILECALAKGAGPVEVSTYTDAPSDRERFAVADISAELIDMPDALRQMVATTVSGRRGATSFITDRARERVRIRVPIHA
jgi:hypothetical protein